MNDDVYQFQAAGSGAFAPVCDLPGATIEASRTDVTPNGDVNEQPVQGSLADTGDPFHVVDCKYQYVLSIPSLEVLARTGSSS